MRRGHGKRGGGPGGSGGGGSASDFSSRRAGKDDKDRAQTLEEARGEVTLGSRVQWHMRSCVTRTGADPEPATWDVQMFRFAWIWAALE